MQTLIVDKDDWMELVQTAQRACACLELVRKLHAQQYLTLSAPEGMDAGDSAQFVQEFEVMIAGNGERLREALIPYEDEEVPDANDA